MGFLGFLEIFYLEWPSQWIEGFMMWNVEIFGGLYRIEGFMWDFRDFIVVCLCLFGTFATVYDVSSPGQES